MRRDIEWKTKRTDGTFYEVRVRYFGRTFKFQFRESTEERWDYKRLPTESDYQTLMEKIQNRYQRRLASLKELESVRQLLLKIERRS